MNLKEIEHRIDAYENELRAIGTRSENEMVHEARKVNHALELFARSKNELTPFHAPFMHQTYTALKSLETGISLAAARANGRLATIFGMNRSIGSGFRVKARAVEKMLFLSPAEFVVDDKTGATYPHSNRAVEASTAVFKRLQSFLDERQQKVLELDLDEQERIEYFIMPGWDLSKLIDYPIEYMARSFAWRVGEPERKAIVFGDKSESSAAFKEAIRSLPFGDLSVA
jgi:hypothetical protein